METLWFYLVALLITGYVILDGFDLGAGAVHLFVARTDRERRAVLQSIGPVWDGNEVWLVAAGGTLVMAFPRVYAAAFSGFYLPLAILVWLLILRAVAIEFRSHLEGPVWRPFWDVVFSGASFLLTILLGVALGNVVRGVPLNDEGYFFAPLWTDFRSGGAEVGVLDGYTVMVGLTSLLALTHHGTLWLVLKTEGAVRDRARRLAARLWLPLLALVLLVTLLSFRVQPHVPTRLAARPGGFLFPLAALLGLVASRRLTSREHESGAFLASALFLAGMLLSVAFGLFPLLLPTTGTAHPSLTVYNAAGPAHGLRVALWWWIPAFVLVLGYTTFVYRRFRGKVRVEEEGY